MKFMASYINKQMMLHFEEIVDEAYIEIYNHPQADKALYSLEVNHTEFIKFPFAVENGHYQIRLKCDHKVETKQIIIK
jgi:hypothetical protein